MKLMMFRTVVAAAFIAAASAQSQIPDGQCVCYGDVDLTDRALSHNALKPPTVRRNLREVRGDRLKREALQVLQSGRQLKDSSDDSHADRHGDDERDCECHEVCVGDDDVSIL